MLKKILIVVGFVALLIALFLVWFMRYTKSHSPQEVIEYKTDGFEIDITYCKPSKKTG
jgi:flagellar basal body-associated protein FliL